MFATSSSQPLTLTHQQGALLIILNDASCLDRQPNSASTLRQQIISIVQRLSEQQTFVPVQIVLESAIPELKTARQLCAAAIGQPMRAFDPAFAHIIDGLLCDATTADLPLANHPDHHQKVLLNLDPEQALSMIEVSPDNGQKNSTPDERACFEQLQHHAQQVRQHLQPRFSRLMQGLTTLCASPRDKSATTLGLSDLGQLFCAPHHV